MPADTPQTQLSLTDLGDLVRAFDQAMLFAFNTDGQVCFTNDRARVVCDAGGPEAWLDGPHFHDPMQKSRIPGHATPLRMVAGRAPGAVQSFGWLDPAGDERILEFRLGPPTPAGFRLLSVEDCTHIWALRQELDGTSEAQGQGVDLADATHGLGNVFGIIQIASDNLSTANLAPDLAQKISDIREAVERGLRLTDTLAGAGPGGEPAMGTPVDAAGILRNVAKLMNRLTPASISFEIDIPPDPCLIQGTVADLEGVVVKLLNLARKSTIPAAGAMALRLCPGGAPEVVIEFGRTPDGASEIRPVPSAMSFKAEVRAIADPLVRQGRGAVRVEDVDIAKRRITLTLPGWSGAAPAKVERVDTLWGRLQGYRIVLAESNALLRSLFGETLGAIGAEVAIAEDGATAQRVLEAFGAIDVLITNPRLSDGVTSDDLVRKAAELGYRPRLIELSGQRSWEDLQAGRTGAVRLRKPVPLLALVNAIRLVTAQSAHTDQVEKHSS